MSIVIIIRAMIRVVFSLGLMFVMLFQSTGRWDYWHGWVFFLLWTYLILFTWLIIPSELLQERTKPGPWDQRMGLYIFHTFFLTLYYSLYCCFRWRTVSLDRQFSSMGECFGIYYYFYRIFIMDPKFAEKSIFFKHSSHSKRERSLCYR